MSENEEIRIEPELNRGQLASVFGVSENTIDKWRAKGMPVETEGGNGVPYGFLLSNCKEWYSQQRDQEAARKREADDFVAQQRMEFLGLKGDDQKAKMSPAEMRELAQAELIWMQAAAKRGELVQVDEVVDLLDAVFTEVRAGLDGFPDWLEREFGLSPDQIERAISFCDGILREMSDKISAANLTNAEPVVDELDRGLF